MIHSTDEAIKLYNDIQIIVAVILGMFLQFFLGDRRGFKIAMLVALSSVFVALFIIPAIIEVAGIDPSSKVAIALYALSAIMSIELLGVLIKFLPKALRSKAKEFLGVRDDI